MCLFFFFFFFCFFFFLFFFLLFPGKSMNVRLSGLWHGWMLWTVCRLIADINASVEKWLMLKLLYLGFFSCFLEMSNEEKWMIRILPLYICAGWIDLCASILGCHFFRGWPCWRGYAGCFNLLIYLSSTNCWHSVGTQSRAWFISKSIMLRPGHRYESKFNLDAI